MKEEVGKGDEKRYMERDCWFCGQLSVVATLAVGEGGPLKISNLNFTGNS